LFHPNKCLVLSQNFPWVPFQLEASLNRGQYAT
jgi:hypothetical protein